MPTTGCASCSPAQLTVQAVTLAKISSELPVQSAATDSARQALELQSEQPELADAQMEASSQHTRACLAADDIAEAALHKVSIFEQSLIASL